MIFLRTFLPPILVLEHTVSVDDLEKSHVSTYNGLCLVMCRGRQGVLQITPLIKFRSPYYKSFYIISSMLDDLYMVAPASMLVPQYII